MNEQFGAADLIRSSRNYTRAFIRDFKPIHSQ
jgi:hypothetical protein